MESSGLPNPTWLTVCYTGDVIFTNGFLYYLRVVCHTEGQPILGSTLGQADASKFHVSTRTAPFDLTLLARYPGIQ